MCAFSSWSMKCPPKTKVLIFSTSGFGTTRYHAELRKALEERGYQVVGDFACKGWDTYGLFKLFGGINKGRPKAKDLDRAREFARGLRPWTIAILGQGTGPSWAPVRREAYRWTDPSTIRQGLNIISKFLYLNDYNIRTIIFPHEHYPGRSVLVG